MKINSENYVDSIKKVKFDKFLKPKIKVKKQCFETVTFFLMADSKPTQKIFKIKDNLFADFLF